MASPETLLLSDRMMDFPDHPVPWSTDSQKVLLLIMCFSPSTGVGASGGTEEQRGLTGGGQDKPHFKGKRTKLSQRSTEPFV